MKIITRECYQCEVCGHLSLYQDHNEKMCREYAEAREQERKDRRAKFEATQQSLVELARNDKPMAVLVQAGLDEAAWHRARFIIEDGCFDYDDYDPGEKGTWIDAMSDAVKQQLADKKEP